MAGYLKFQIHTGDDALPVFDAKITVYYHDGRVIYRTKTDRNGNTQSYTLAAPDKKYTLDPNYMQPAYSVYDADIEADGYITLHVTNIPVVDTQTTIMEEELHPLPTDEMITDEYIDIAPISLISDVVSDQSNPPPVMRDVSEIPYAADNPPPGPRVIGRGARVPDYITVHLGIPTNASARNVRVRFADYVKNVASSEIYSTWPNNSLEANIHAIVTFALNRVYTEWYRSRGYNFDITNSTRYDMAFRDGGPVFENISKMVDAIFNVYARRIGFENPFFTEFCNGSTVTCNGMSQWGTVTLANQGKNPLEILRYYYPKDLELVISNNVGGIEESYPGYALRVGSEGSHVQRIQGFLNRIRVNFPLIPLISNPNGIFGQDTADAVRAFQRSFDLTADGIVGRATWNKINFIFVAVTKLAELESEGIRIGIGERPPTSTLSSGSRGGDVIELQFLLNFIGAFYSSIPIVIQDGVFGPGTKNAVIEFQKEFGLTTDGIVGPLTWNRLYSVYKGIQENVDDPPPADPIIKDPVTDPDPVSTLPYPGRPLALGSTGSNVRLIQSYFNVINAVYHLGSMLTVDGVFGPKTQEAIKSFQNKFFLRPDAMVCKLTWDKIMEVYLLTSGNKPADLEFPGTLLRIGSQGSAVRLMQTFLYELRSPYPSLPQVTVDGIFGPNTEQAVITFQKLRGLEPDGIIGPITWEAIIKERNKMG